MQTDNLGLAANWAADSSNSSGPVASSRAIVGYYDEHAERLAQKYESLSFDEVHKQLLPYLPQPPGKVIDIGAGSGRDAAALAQRGFDVTAVEPSTKLLDLARRKHRNLNITWLEDKLPNLECLKDENAFNIFFCSAIWMHLDREAQIKSMRTISRLIKDKGRLFITFRSKSEGEAVEIFDVSPRDIIDDAIGSGFSLLHSAKSVDWLGRAGVYWHLVVLEKISE